MAGLIVRRGIRHDVQSFDQGTDVVTVLLDPVGDLVKTAAGIGMDLVLDQGVYVITDAQKINVPALPNDIVRLVDLQAVLAGLSWKDAVRVMENAFNINVGAAPGTIDGVILAAGDRILLNAQGAPAENGIWEFVAGGAPLIRPVDFPVGGDAAAAAVFVAQGAVNMDTAWSQTLDPAVIDTNNQSWAQFSGGAGAVPGTGITPAGNVFNVTAADASILVNPNDLNVQYSATNSGLETAVDGVRISIGAAGDGITGGGGLPLAVQAADASIGVGPGGISVNPAALIQGGVQEVDGDLIDIDYVPVNYTETIVAPATALDQLTAHLAGIDAALAVAGGIYTAGPGLEELPANQFNVLPDITTGGDVSPVTVGVNGTGVDVTLLDGDHLEITWVPTFYIPDDTPPEAADLADLTAHLKGIDAVLGGVQATSEIREVTAAEAAANLLTLTAAPRTATRVSGDWAEGGTGVDTVDFTINYGTGDVDWSIGDWNGKLIAGDVIVFHYYMGIPGTTTGDIDVLPV